MAGGKVSLGQVFGQHVADVVAGNIGGLLLAVLGYGFFSGHAGDLGVAKGLDRW